MIATAIRNHAVALAALLAVTPLFGDTAEIDIAALAAATNQFTSECKIATTNGWTLCDIDSYSEKNGAANIRINRNVKDEYIDSPTFDHPIIRIELKVKSSGQTGRKLALIPIYNGSPTADTNLWARCEYSPTKDTYVPQTNFFPRSAEVHAFRMALDDGGGSTGWGVSMITIITDDSPQLTPPSELHADNVKGTRFALSWTNPENAVSNRIEVSEIVEIETSGGSILEYDFNDFTNNNDRAKDITDDFTNSIPAFTGSTLIRLPAHTNGIIQISKDDTKGYLVHSGFADYSNMSMVISLRVPTDSQLKTFGVGYLSSEGTTNEFATFSMGVAFQTNTVSLADVPANASIVLNTQGTSHKRVVYVDYLAFVNTGPTTICETNLVKTAFVTDSTTYSVRGLCPRTEYVARITAFDAEGNESSPSEPLAVTTNGEALPFSIRIQ